MKKTCLLICGAFTFFSMEAKAIEVELKCPDRDTAILFKNDTNCTKSLVDDGYCYEYNAANSGALLLGKHTETYGTGAKLSWTGKTSYIDQPNPSEDITATLASNLVLEGDTLQLECAYNVNGLAGKNNTFYLWAFADKNSHCKVVEGKEKGLFNCSLLDA